MHPDDPTDERGVDEATIDVSLREHLADVYSPLGDEQRPEELLIGPRSTVIDGLNTLTGWVDNPRDRYLLAVPLLRRTVELLGATDLAAVIGVERLHFIYLGVMERSYKLREETAWLEVTVWAAQSMVAIAPRPPPRTSALPGTGSATSHRRPAPGDPRRQVGRPR